MPISSSDTSNFPVRALSTLEKQQCQKKNIDLHGSAPDKHKFALLLIDVINDFDFPEADQLLKYARPRATNVLRLKRRNDAPKKRAFR